MHITASRNHKGRYGLSLLLLGGMLYAAAIAEEVLEESPVCPGRPLYVQPTEKDVAEMGLSLEILCIIVDTYLFRHDLPGPDESPDLLRRYLRQGPYEHLSDAQYRAVMEEAVRLWPQSRYAHAGLAQALLAGHGIQGDPADVRRAAEEFLTAAEIAFSEGKVRYVTELAQLLADIGDKAALDRYFERVFKLLPEGEGRYMSYLDYARALAKLGDERAETYFRKAIAVSPEGVGDAYDSYARYLLQHHKAQAALELLVPNSKVEQAMYKPAFHYLRCQALEQVGRKAEATEECQRARDLSPPMKGPSPGGLPGGEPSTRGPLAPAEPGLLARLLGVGLAHADYENINDDCRVNQQRPNNCTFHPEDTRPPESRICFYDFVWNLAELITREAVGESFGSRAAVAWTVRDRVLRVSTPECGTFGGATGTCTSQCPDPQFCDLQRKYCCVIRSGQFSFSSVPVSVENLYLAYDVVDSHTPEPTSDFVPTGASGCTRNVCDNRLVCSQYGNDYEYAPEGPIYFYSNRATSYGCRGFQPGIPSNCNVVAKETCGNSPDGAPRFQDDADNCYGRATRNRTWKAGTHFTGSVGVTTSGDTKRLSPLACMHRTDGFKNPGGKEVVVQARLETAGQANLRVQLKNSSGAVIHDFGTLAVTSTTFSDKVFSSAVIVTAPVSRVDIINEGPGTVIGQTVIVRD